MPSTSPKTSRVPANAAKLRLAPTSATDAAVAGTANRTSWALPYRRASRPAACIEISAPAAGLSSAAPSCASLSRSPALNCGIWMNQADMISPMVKKIAATAQLAEAARARAASAPVAAVPGGAAVITGSPRRAAARTGPAPRTRPRRSRRRAAGGCRPGAR